VIVYLALLDNVRNSLQQVLRADIAGAGITDSQAFNELGARVTVEEKAEEQ